MRHYVQYHNSDKNGGRPQVQGNGFAIYANKSIRHLVGQRIWLVSGETRTQTPVSQQKRKKSYFLETTFVVDEVIDGNPKVARGRHGIRFDPAIPLDGLPWFKELQQQQQNFSLGVREINPGTLVWLEAFAAKHDAVNELTPQESAAAAEIDADPQCSHITATERDALIHARIGQGTYRRNLMSLWDGRCAVTGCRIDAVLVASHAKPWRISSNTERLDPYNGLLLAASVDRLFDQGLIAFDDQGKVLISHALVEADLSCIGLAKSSRLSRVDKRHIPYLRAHRDKVFQP